MNKSRSTYSCQTPELQKHFPSSDWSEKLRRTARSLLCIITPQVVQVRNMSSALLRDIRNVRICMRKKPILFNLKKNSLPYIKCVLCHSCVVHGPIYGRFMGCYVTSFLSIYIWLNLCKHGFSECLHYYLLHWKLKDLFQPQSVNSALQAKAWFSPSWSHLSTI